MRSLEPHGWQFASLPPLSLAAQHRKWCGQEGMVGEAEAQEGSPEATPLSAAARKRLSALMKARRAERKKATG